MSRDDDITRAEIVALSAQVGSLTRRVYQLEQTIESLTAARPAPTPAQQPSTYVVPRRQPAAPAPMAPRRVAPPPAVRGRRSRRDRSASPSTGRSWRSRHSPRAPWPGPAASPPPSASLCCSCWPPAADGSPPRCGWDWACWSRWGCWGPPSISTGAVGAPTRSCPPAAPASPGSTPRCGPRSRCTTSSPRRWAFPAPPPSRRSRSPWRSGSSRSRWPSSGSSPRCWHRRWCHRTSPAGERCSPS